MDLCGVSHLVTGYSRSHSCTSSSGTTHLGDLQSRVSSLIEIEPTVQQCMSTLGDKYQYQSCGIDLPEMHEIYIANILILSSLLGLPHYLSSPSCG